MTSLAPNSSGPSGEHRLRVRLPLLLAIPDVIILYAGLLIGYKIRFESWLLPHTTEWGVGTLIVLGVYVGAMVASGLYTTSPRRMHLREFLRVGTWLIGAWGLSVTVTYVVSPENLPPRSVMAVHGLVALVGILGLRAVLRRGIEHLSTAPEETAPGIADTEVQLRDLVPREPVDIDRAALRDYLSGRTVLVTGAGGSIGSELSRQLVDLDPFRLVFVDVSEYNLYQLETSMRAERYDGDMEFCIADVRDASIMDGLYTSMQPDVVLHTAAYKHVPLMERHPAEAFRNNTLATVHLLDLSEQHDVEQFVFVSTDKAVEPTSVLGATKRMAEWYVRAATSDVKRKIVRFGNVFGSQGSVVPRFEEQLDAGEPLPVTHPEMERYFMSVDEACSLILQTVLFNAHPVYILRMGDPVSIRWLAEQMIERRYPHVDPDAMIEYVGRRPGEKLSEDLLTPTETPDNTTHDSIVGVDSAVPFSRTELELYFRHLRSLCQNPHASKAQVRRALFETHLDSAEQDASS